MSKGKTFWAALAFGVIAALSQPPVSIPWVLALALPGLFWLWSGALTGRRAFWIGWFGGLGYFGATLHWIAEPFLVEPEVYGWMIPFAVAAMAGGMSLFWGAGFWLAKRLCGAASRETWAAPFALAAALAGMEWLRGNILSGFPWSLLGYAWVETDAIQVAALVGVYGVTLLTVLSGFLLGQVLVSRSLLRRAVPAIVAVSLIAAMHVYGLTRLQAGRALPSPDAPQIGLVQPNVPQREKWKPDFVRAQLDDLLAKTRELSDRGADVVIWPEAATPYRIDENSALREMIAASLNPGGIVLAGGIRFDTEDRAYNSLIAVGQDARILGIYDKQHLVPFGEMMPLEPLLTRLGVRTMISLPGGFATGAEQERSMTLGDLPSFVPMICYEAIFPAEIMRRAAKGDWLVQITNDAWFGKWVGPYQHLSMARVRAIERGLPLARAANTGVSAIIDGQGRVLKSLLLNEAGVVLGALPKRAPATLYASLEDIPFGIALLACFGLGSVGRRQKVIKDNLINP